jgi:hypothetical protein
MMLNVLLKVITFLSKMQLEVTQTCNVYTYFGNFYQDMSLNEIKLSNIMVSEGGIQFNNIG